MEKINSLKAKAIVLTGLTLGGLSLSACDPQVEDDSKGVAKEKLELVINPLDPLINRKYCTIDEGEEVTKGRDSYVSDGTMSVDVTLIEGENCSGWSFNNDYLEYIDWGKK